jgi:hypothetical protein
LQPAPAARSKEKFVELPSVDEEFLPPDVTVDMPARTIFEVGSSKMGQRERIG